MAAHLDLFGIEAEDWAYNDRKRGSRAVTHINRVRLNTHAAVALYKHRGDNAVTRSAIGLHAHCEAGSVGQTLGCVLRFDRLAIGPKRMSLYAVKHFAQTQFLHDRTADDSDRFRRSEIDAASRERVPALGGDNVVEGGLNREESLRPAETALRSAGNILRMDRLSKNIRSRNLVSSADTQRGEIGDIRREIFSVRRP